MWIAGFGSRVLEDYITNTLVFVSVFSLFGIFRGLCEFSIHIAFITVPKLPSKACTEAYLPGNSKICLQRIDYFGCANWHKNILILGGFISLDKVSLYKTEMGNSKQHEFLQPYFLMVGSL